MLSVQVIVQLLLYRAKQHTRIVALTMLDDIDMANLEWSEESVVDISASRSLILQLTEPAAH